MLKRSVRSHKPKKRRGNQNGERRRNGEKGEEREKERKSGEKGVLEGMMNARRAYH